MERKGKKEQKRGKERERGVVERKGRREQENGEGRDRKERRKDRHEETQG